MGFSDTHRRYSRHRNTKGSSPGRPKKASDAEVAIFAVSAIVSAVIGLFALILRLFLILIPVVIVIVIIYGIYDSIKQRRVEEERKEQEKKNDLAWLKLPEPSHKGAQMPTYSSSPKELERIGSDYCEYLKTLDNINHIKKHIDWITKTDNINKKYELSSEIDCRSELDKANSELRNEEKKLTKLKYRNNIRFNVRTEEIENKYNRLITALNTAQNKLKHEDSDVLGFFDKRNTISTSTVWGSDFFICAPWYVFTIESKTFKTLNIVKYTDLTLNHWFNEEEVNYALYSDDIARVKYEHEKKNGGPDLRYANNKKTTYVYRGHVGISLKGKTAGEYDIILNFPNKGKTNEFINSWKAYEECLKKRDNSAIIKAVLDNKYNSIDEYFNEKDRKRKINTQKAKEESVKQVKEHINPTEVLKPGKIIVHKTFGPGTIIKIESGYLIVKFGDKERKFVYPEAIQKGYFSLK